MIDAPLPLTPSHRGEGEKMAKLVALDFCKSLKTDN